MSQSNSNTSGKHAKRKSRRGLIAVLVVLSVLLAAALAAGAYLVLSGGNARDAAHTQTAAPPSTAGSPVAEEGPASAADAAAPSDRDVSEAQKRKAEQQAAEEAARIERERIESGIPTPLIAEYDGVKLHTPIRTKELEGILFHQAATDYGLPLTTQLPDADPDEVIETGDYEIAAEQPIGDEWIVARALHLWREDTSTEMDTSIDVGAEAGTDVYSPVTGTVVLVRTYMLYDTVEDYEIHIQPDGRPDLDVVEIHITDVAVKPGDKVIGGETILAKVRDLAAEDITDIQLSFYSKQGHGNHTHVQVNNADAPEYRETRLADAYQVKEG